MRDKRRSVLLRQGVLVKPPVRPGSVRLASEATSACIAVNVADPHSRSLAFVRKAEPGQRNRDSVTVESYDRRIFRLYSATAEAMLIGGMSADSIPSLADFRSMLATFASER